MTLPRALLLTDRSQFPLGRSLLATVEAAVSAGLDHVVLRELDLPDVERAGLAAEFLEAGATVIAAHRWVPGCVAVQLPSEVSRLGRGPRTSITEADHFGRSCHTAAEVRAAAAEGASYATLGPFAVTESKPGYGPPLDPSAYAGLPLPTYALGGVTPDNARAALDRGAHGVAVMGAVMRAEHPDRAAAALMAAVAEGERP